jgi:TusA-related sulfurtransferase
LKSIEVRRRRDVEGERCPVAAIEEDSAVEADPGMRIAEDC